MTTISVPERARRIEQLRDAVAAGVTLYGPLDIEALLDEIDALRADCPHQTPSPASSPTLGGEAERKHEAGDGNPTTTPGGVA